MIRARKRGVIVQQHRFCMGAIIDAEFYNKDFVIALKEGTPFYVEDTIPNRMRVIEKPYNAHIVTGNESALWWAPWAFYAWVILAVGCLCWWLG